MRRAASVAALVVAVVTSAFASASTTSRSTGTTTVTVDLGAARQVIQGFGSSNRVWSDPHLAKAPEIAVPAAAQDEILALLYRRLGLTRVRDVLDTGIQPAPGAPFRFDGKLTDDHVAFVKQARRFGLRTFFPGPVYLEPWMTPSDPGAYVDWAMAVLRRWRVQGAEPPFYAPLNEPKIAGDFPPDWMRRVVVQLGRRLRAEGFRTKLVVPDDENPTDAYRRAAAVLADPAARPYIGALAYHVYKWNRADMVRMRQLATRYGLPVWMTEYSSPNYVDWSSALDWAVRMHELLTAGGVNAIDYLWSYFGSWVRTDTMLSIDFEKGAYRGFTPTPIYWLTGQYARYVRPGDVRVGTRSTSSRVLVSAYRAPGKAVVVATNPHAAPETLRVEVEGGAFRGVARPVRSSATETWRALPSVAIRDGGFVATLPPASVTTFVVRR